MGRKFRSKPTGIVPSANLYKCQKAVFCLVILWQTGTRTKRAIRASMTAISLCIGGRWKRGMGAILEMARLSTTGMKIRGIIQTGTCSAQAEARIQGIMQRNAAGGKAISSKRPWKRVNIVEDEKAWFGRHESCNQCLTLLNIGRETLFFFM